MPNLWPQNRQPQWSAA